MGWRVWGEPLLTADMSGTPRVFQPVIFNSDLILKGMRTWVIAYNDPAFTALTMEIYSNRGGSPGKLLYTSTNSLLKADVHTLANGVKEIYFDFDQLPIFKSTDTYHFVLKASGYTGDSTTHLAWMKAFPDPVYRTNNTPNFVGLATNPFQLYFIGSEL